MLTGVDRKDHAIIYFPFLDLVARLLDASHLLVPLSLLLGPCSEHRVRSSQPRRRANVGIV